LKEKTLCFLIYGDPPGSILLGFKKRGFGAGKYAGIGGGLEPGETPSSAALRELFEETMVQAQEKDLYLRGSLTFLFPYRPDWSQVVYVFWLARWQGSPQETDEMSPAWFSFQDIPFHQMWQDNAIWLPRLLTGRSLTGSFTFAADNETVVDYHFEEP
jgi:8-oxo-dGTP diphosphatase